MKERNSGKIINFSSSTAYWGTPNFLHYVASKAALIGNPDNVHTEQAGDQIDR